MSESVQRLASLKAAIKKLQVAEGEALLKVYDKWFKHVKGSMDRGTLLKARQELKWIRAEYMNGNPKAAERHFENFNEILEVLEHHIERELGSVAQEARKSEIEAKKAQNEAVERQQEALKQHQEAIQKQQQAAQQAQTAREQRKQARKS